MNKKALYSILSTIVAMIVLSVSLVFAIGPRVSAARVEVVGEEHIVVLDDWDDFNISDDGTLHDISGMARTYLSSMKVYESCGVFYPGYDCEITGISLVIPEGVKSIGRRVFCDDSGFNSFYVSVFLPQTLEYISDEAFRNCDRLESVNIPTNVIAIGASAFEACYNLTSLCIPKNVNFIDGGSFFRCNNLTTIYCECSEEYAREHWSEYWNVKAGTMENPEYYEVVWNYKAELTITFDSGVASQIIKNGENAVEPTAPTKDGYEFKGWLLNGEPYDFATPVTEDVTLTAKWEEVQSQPEPETPVEENTEVNNQNNAGLIWGIAGTSAGVLIIAGIVVGIVISKRRRK